jgi:hypothetical protein
MEKTRTGSSIFPEFPDRVAVLYFDDGSHRNLVRLAPVSIE